MSDKSVNFHEHWNIAKMLPTGLSLWVNFIPAEASFARLMSSLVMTQFPQPTSERRWQAQRRRLGFQVLILISKHTSYQKGLSTTYTAVFMKSRQHVCHVRRKIQMSDVGFVKIIIIWCLRLPIVRRRVKSIREDWYRLSSCFKNAFPPAEFWKKPSTPKIMTER